MSEKPISPEAITGDRAFFGHPRGLKTLFFAEMWERFSYYGMRAFLSLYAATSLENGGLGFSWANAGLIYGLYTSMVYMLSVPGGWIADRYLGQQRAVLYGGILIMSGHIVLAIPSPHTFFLGLALVALGTGLLKPNISTIVGQLYGPDDGRRDAGFSIFYMGINIGAMIAPMVCGTLLAEGKWIRGFLDGMGVSPNAAWHLAFGAAAVGMFFGLVQFWLGQKYLGEAGKHPVKARTPAESKRNNLILGGVIAAFIGVPALLAVLHVTGAIAITGDAIAAVTDYLYIGLAVAVFGLLFAYGAENGDERRRLVVMMVLFAAAVVFWACFEQAGSTLTLFAAEHTRREIFGWEFGATLYQSLNSIFVILLAPLYAWMWVSLARRRREPVTPFKFALGMFFVGVGYLVMLPAAQMVVGGEKAGPLWLVGLYFMHTIGELFLSPVGLSAMSRLAPARWGGLVLGIWFLASSIGNYLAGRAVGLSQKLALDDYFLVVALIPIGLAVVLGLLAKPINNLLRREDAAKAGH
jgi:POT family proton-dependent oligopeptide transporter